MPYSLAIVGLLFALIQWYQKHIEPDLRLEIGTLLTNRVKALLNTLATEYVVVTFTKQDNAKNEWELKLKENIEMQSVKTEVFALAAKLKDAQRAERCMKQLRWIQKRLIWFVLLSFASEALVLCKEKLHPLGFVSKFTTADWVNYLSCVSNCIVPINTLITIGMLLLMMVYVANLLLIYTFKALE